MNYEFQNSTNIEEVNRENYYIPNIVGLEEANPISYSQPYVNIDYPTNPIISRFNQTTYQQITSITQPEFGVINQQQLTPVINAQSNLRITQQPNPMSHPQFNFMMYQVPNIMIQQLTNSLSQTHINPMVQPIPNLTIHQPSPMSHTQLSPMINMNPSQISHQPSHTYVLSDKTIVGQLKRASVLYNKLKHFVSNNVVIDMNLEELEYMEISRIRMNMHHLFYCPIPCESVECTMIQGEVDHIKRIYEQNKLMCCVSCSACYNGLYIMNVHLLYCFRPENCNWEAHKLFHKLITNLVTSFNNLKTLFEFAQTEFGSILEYLFYYLEKTEMGRGIIRSATPQDIAFVDFLVKANSPRKETVFNLTIYRYIAIKNRLLCNHLIHIEYCPGFRCILTDCFRMRVANIHLKQNYVVNRLFCVHTCWKCICITDILIKHASTCPNSKLCGIPMHRRMEELVWSQKSFLEYANNISLDPTITTKPAMIVYMLGNYLSEHPYWNQPQIN